ncbi:MAG: YhfC family intramembrane metalloprotease [Ruminococcus sp.]|nr:YhfC family intramembrane metalloprotease [Ruminococcus sp.]
MIPNLTIIAIIFCILVCFGTPVALIIGFRVKKQMPLLPILIGALSFFVTVMVIESAFHSVILGLFPQIRKSVLLYTLYGASAAGVFEESARLLCFILIKKYSTKPQTVLTGISYGIGHGSFEAVVLVGLSMVSNLILALQINLMGIDTLTSLMPGTAVSALEQVYTALRDTPSLIFFYSGIERIAAIGAQIALSVIMYHAVNTPKRKLLYPLAILLHMILDVPAALYQVNSGISIDLTEILTFVLAALIVGCAVLITQKSEIRNQKSE